MAYNENPAYSPLAGNASLVTIGTVTTGTWQASVITVAHGGTGQSTLTNHGILIGAATAAITQLAAGSAGQILQSGGASADPAYSTATYPAIATGTNKILIADGTNWVASTPTYPTSAGTSGNVLTSDGTNWISSAAAGSGGYILSMTNTIGGTPVNATNYYMYRGQYNATSTEGTSGSIMVVPKDGTVTKVYGALTCIGLGSAGSVTVKLRLNNTTSTTITSSLSLTTADNPFNATVSIAVVAGDYLEFNILSPTWVTPPTIVSFSGALLIT